MEVTLNLPENIYRNFTKLAEQKQRRVEDVIADRLQNDIEIESAEFEEIIAAWSDDDVLALANLKLPKEQADRMSELSERRQMGSVSSAENSEFDMYMELYNIANLRKAHGIVEAVKRGLLKSPDDLI